MKSKKGISAVVATVLIILITVAAVAIIWAAIIPMIRDNIGGSTECFTASSALSVVSDYSCYDEDANEVKIQVHRDAGDFELVAVKLQVGYQGTTNSSTNSTVPDQNEDRVYTLDVDELGLGGVDEVGVVAVVQAGNTKKECDSSGSITVSACS